MPGRDASRSRCAEAVARRISATAASMSARRSMASRETSTSPAFTFWPSCELDLFDDARHFRRHRDGFEGAHRSHRVARLDDAAGLHRVDLDHGCAARSAGTAPPAGPLLRLRRLSEVGPDRRSLGQMTFLVGIPAAEARCAQHGYGGELTDDTHARSSRTLECRGPPSTIYARIAPKIGSDTKFCREFFVSYGFVISPTVVPAA